MKEALADRPATPFRLPSGLRLIRIAYKTGTRAQPGDDPVIWEAFKPGTEPGDEANTKVIEGTSNYGKDAGYGTSVPVDDTGAGQDEQPGSGGGDESPAPAPSPVPSSVSPGPVSGAPPDGGIY
jgi:penicillin-binding protein 1A